MHAGMQGECGRVPPLASLLLRRCCFRWYHDPENFYMGATLLEASNATDTLGECCVLCRCAQFG